MKWDYRRLYLVKTVRISSLIIGILMIGQWVFFIASGNVPELKTTPISIIFHIVIELITALLLIFSAIALHKPEKWKIYLAVYSQGMLGYTVVNSSGYFAQSGEWIFIVMFALLLAVSIINTVMLIRVNKNLS